MRPKFLDIKVCEPRRSFKLPLFSNEMWAEIVCMLISISFLVGLVLGFAINYSIVFKGVTE